MAAESLAPVCSPVRRGFALACLQCGADACITLDLADLDTLHCPECDAEYNVADVRTTLAAWQKLLAWIELAPEQFS